MSDALSLLRSLHNLNSVLIVVLGLLSVVLLVWRLVRRGGRDPRGPLRLFVAVLSLQVLLGLGLLGLLAALGATAFPWRHVGGGLLAALLGTLALWQHGRSARPGLAALWCALSLVTVGLFA